jgi:hypothetical protein
MCLHAAHISQYRTATANTNSSRTQPIYLVECGHCSSTIVLVRLYKVLLLHGCMECILCAHALSAWHISLMLQLLSTNSSRTGAAVALCRLIELLCSRAVVFAADYSAHTVNAYCNCVNCNCKQKQFTNRCSSGAVVWCNYAETGHYSEDQSLHEAMFLTGGLR